MVSSSERARLLEQDEEEDERNYGSVESPPNERIRETDSSGILLQRTIFCASMFSLFGVMWGHFNSQIPVTKENLSIDDSQFGLLLLFDDLGSFIGQALANQLPLLLTSTLLTPLIGISVVIFAGLTNLSRRSKQFAPAMLTFGTLASLFDIAINIQIVALGRDTKRADAPFFHGLFSAGQLTGSGLGTLLTHFSVQFEKRVISTALGLATIFALHFPFIPKVDQIEAASYAACATDQVNDTEQEEEEESSTDRQNPQSIRTKIILLSAIGFLCSICEGSLSEWAGIYLRQNLNTSFVLANAAAFTYSIGMTFARLIGTWAARKAGIKAIIVSGSLLTCISLFVGLTINEPKAFLIVVMFAAMGLANITPLSMSILSQLPAEKQALFVARVSLAQQIGFFGGPVLIGTLSGWLGLRLALIMIPLCSLGVALWSLPLQIRAS